MGDGRGGERRIVHKFAFSVCTILPTAGRFRLGYKGHERRMVTGLCSVERNEWDLVVESLPEISVLFFCGEEEQEVMVPSPEHDSIVLRSLIRMNCSQPLSLAASS